MNTRSLFSLCVSPQKGLKGSSLLAHPKVPTLGKCSSPGTSQSPPCCAGHPEHRGRSPAPLGFPPSHSTGCHRPLPPRLPMVCRWKRSWPWISFSCFDSGFLCFEVGASARGQVWKFPGSLSEEEPAEGDFDHVMCLVRHSLVPSFKTSR